jgi:hypothetical protein
MIKLNSIGLAGAILAAVSVSPAVMAQTVELYYGPYAYGAGGEFTAVASPSLYNADYAPSALVTVTDPYNNQQVQGFETFCVQSEVDFTPYNWGNPMPYNIGTSLSSIGTPDNFALSLGTAWLYSQFATGQLQGYDYTDAGTRTADAGLLQSAIWALQGGQSYGGFPSGTAGNPYYDEAVTALGLGAINEAATSSDNFGVEILNLTSGGNPAQNQLVYTVDPPDPPRPHIPEVPDSGATLALLAVSLAGLAAFGPGFGAPRLALQACPPPRSSRPPGRVR